MLFSKKTRLNMIILDHVEVLNPDFDPESGLDYIKSHGKLLFSKPHINTLDTVYLSNENGIPTISFCLSEGIGQPKKSLLLHRKHKKSPAVSPKRNIEDGSPVLSKNKKFESEENEFLLEKQNENNEVSSPIKSRFKDGLSGMGSSINPKTTKETLNRDPNQGKEERYEKHKIIYDDNEKDNEKYSNFKEIDDDEGDGSNSDSNDDNFDEINTYVNNKKEIKEEDILISNENKNNENHGNNDSITENKININASSKGKKDDVIDKNNIEENTQTIIPKENQNNEEMLNKSNDLNLKSPEKPLNKDIDTSVTSGGNNSGRRIYGKGNKCPRSTAKSLTMNKNHFKFPYVEKINDIEERTIIGHSNLEISNHDETSQSPSGKKKKKNRRRRKK
jgi:hypothetical protein